MKTKLSVILLVILLNAGGRCAAESQDETAVPALVKGNTRFSLDLYARLRTQEGNLFFSPYSISTALAMTWGGARSRTAEQMAQTLHFTECLDPETPGRQERLHEAFGRLIAQLNQQGQKGEYQLSVANALWGQKDFAFLDAFMQLNKKYYHAGLENVDFVKETEPTRVKINQWVEDKTQSKIKDLIPPGILDSMTRLVLTNAIYFKGDWADRFDGQQTRAEPFYVSQEKTVQAPLMYRKGQYPYGEPVSLRNDRRVKVQVLVLPYKGNDVSMVVLLPEKGDLRHVEEDLSAETLAVWTSQLRPQEVEVFLPKFRMTRQFSLARTLAAMGMPDAFGDAADFSGMTGAKDLLISDVLHKAFVEVNEEGTEAAAATGVVMRLRSMPAPASVFRADRPFVFVIRDNATGSILFMGRVADPTDTGS